MTVVYIAHPIGGDVENNIKEVLRIVSDIQMHKKDVHPFAPYIVDLMTLNDNIPAHREKGMAHNEAILKSGFVDEIWLFGDRISNGMQAELDIAKEMNLTIKSYIGCR